MKRYLCTAMLCCLGLYGRAQGGMFGAKIGVGYTTAYDSKITPAVEAFYLQKFNYHIFFGGSVSFQRYSMLNTLHTGSTANYGDVISISHKTSYLFLTPKIDIGIGYRKYFHVHLSGGPGFFVGGGQWTNTHQPFWTPPGGTPYGADTVAVNTSYNVPGVLFRFGLGVTERIPTHGYWNITLTQEFGYLPGSLSKGTPALNTPHLLFQVGIMHKYPHVRMEY